LTVGKRINAGIDAPKFDIGSANQRGIIPLKRPFLGIINFDFKMGRLIQKKAKKSHRRIVLLGALQKRSCFGVSKSQYFEKFLTPPRGGEKKVA
jgi:hypothetical protein